MNMEKSLELYEAFAVQNGRNEVMKAVLRAALSAEIEGRRLSPDEIVRLFKPFVRTPQDIRAEYGIPTE